MRFPPAPLRVFSLCALCLLAACGSRARASDSVVSGRSAGRVFLGMARADVWKILGKPRYTLAVPHGGSLYGEDDWTKAGQTLSVISERDAVIQIEFSSPRFVTTDGLSTRSTFAQVRRRHPAMTARAYLLDYHRILSSRTPKVDYYDSYYVDDVRGGIAFTDGPDEGIGPETINSVLSTLIVHRPGSEVLPLHNGFWGLPNKEPFGLTLLQSWFTPKADSK